MFSNFNFYQTLLMVLPFIFAVTAHEFGHGYAARRLGDDTAMLAGRLTLNPLKHLDPFGSIILPLILIVTGSPVLFGYAKPVPVNFSKLKNKNFRLGVVMVSAAGILVNLGCAFLSGAIFRVFIWLDGFGGGFQSSAFLSDFMRLLEYSVIINCVLAVFNMIPIPPLDGSKILAMILPVSIRRLYLSLERFGMIILAALIILASDLFRKIMVFFLGPLVNFFMGA